MYSTCSKGKGKSDNERGMKVRESSERDTGKRKIEGTNMRYKFV